MSLTLKQYTLFKDIPVGCLITFGERSCSGYFCLYLKVSMDKVIHIGGIDRCILLETVGDYYCMYIIEVDYAK
jgi:hypothetical protein